MKIIRILFRMLSAVALLGGVVAASIDAIQSVSTSSIVMTSVGNAWLNLDPESLTLMEVSTGARSDENLRPYMAFLLAQPAFAVLFTIALLFWMAGYKAPKRVTRRPRRFFTRRLWT